MVQEYYLQKDRIKTYEGEIENLEKLSGSSRKTLTEINEGFRDGKMSCSWALPVQEKTHLYLEKIEETIANGKNVLFLLPEIALTKQIIQRLEKNTENNSVLSSKL